MWPSNGTARYARECSSSFFGLRRPPHACLKLGDAFVTIFYEAERPFFFFFLFPFFFFSPRPRKKACPRHNCALRNARISTSWNYPPLPPSLVVILLYPLAKRLSPTCSRLAHPGSAPFRAFADIAGQLWADLCLRSRWTLLGWVLARFSRRVFGTVTKHGHTLLADD